ncbi:plasmid pRiA4b ORF-3 family protein [Solwaraspora sp. WMMB335]|uniref:plasmid pRiA4b ORF-3 family protein n=1 Tax=Solwaraspora sp. WMMB335 TaxID=3404118 RepID=UPI003B962FD6
MSEGDLAGAAASAPALHQVVALSRWVGAGRRLTQTGQLTMADARHLVGLLETGDEIDPMIGTRMFRTRSSAELPRLAIVVAWAKATGLLRVVHGRLVPVKKNQRLTDRPEALWAAMFAAFDQLGPALCPPGWFAALLGEDFADGIAVLFAGIAEGGGAVTLDEAQDQVWSTLTARYYLEHATTEQLGRIRKATDRDLHRAVDELVALGVLSDDTGTLRLSPAAEQVLRARFGAVRPGDQIAQIKVTLLDTEPPVWRRLLVPATLRLDRLDRVIQAAMGWTNSHLHMFIHPTGNYGTPDLDLPIQDDREASLLDLAGKEGETFGYEYDFGDGWTHEVLLEKLVPAEPAGQYPACTDGARACPPEDCGGTGGYEQLLDTLADPRHPDHHHLRQWLGLEQGIDLDPAHFDTTGANRRITAVICARQPGS